MLLQALCLHKQAEKVSDTCLFMHKCCCTKDIKHKIKMPPTSSTGGGTVVGRRELHV